MHCTGGLRGSSAVAIAGAGAWVRAGAGPPHAASASASASRSRCPRDIRVARMSCPLVGADELALGEDMALHRLLDVGLRRMTQVERAVERVELEDIAVPAARRARAVPGRVL